MAVCETCGQEIPKPPVELPTEVIIDEAGWYFERKGGAVYMVPSPFSGGENRREVAGFMTYGSQFSWYPTGVWVKDNYPNDSDIVRKATPEEAAELNEKYINNEVRPAN